MNYTSTNYRNIKNFSGARGIVSRMRSQSAETRYNNIKSSSILNSDSSSSLGSDSSIASLRNELKTYSKIASDSASNMQTNGEKLVAEGEESLFGNAAKSGNTKSIVSRAEDFVNDFNNMISSLKKLGGDANTEFVSQLGKYAEADSEALGKIGITVLKDGSLTMNQNILKEASLENLKAVFNGNDSFAAKVTDLSDDIEKNVEKKLQENLLILAKNSSTYSNASGTSGSYYNKYV